jgi:16S rRNA (cytidine1402-2'-O)-methyltransferase
VKEIPATLAFYESPHRLAKSLIDCREILGDRQAAIARELTKLHEEIRRGTIADLVEFFSSTKVRGEIVFIIDRAAPVVIRSADPVTLIERVKQLENEGNDRKTSLKQAAKEFGLSKSKAYRILESDKN